MKPAQYQPKYFLISFMAYKFVITFYLPSLYLFNDSRKTFSNSFSYFNVILNRSYKRFTLYLDYKSVTRFPFKLN